MSSGRTVQGMTNMAAVKGYIVVASKPEHSKELSLYTTQDTDSWHHAQFGDHKIEQDAYTILESTNYSIQVDVMTSKYITMGNLYTSNSEGNYFTKNVEHTNRNQDGYVDFEKIANIQGVVLVNTVDNWEAYGKSGQTKKLKSRISFDDGRSFEKLTVKGNDDELHLHSVTNLHNSGRVFSSPAPGLVMGVGNTGDHLGKYTDGDLYVSDDAGLTWELVLSEAHKYEFGDQGSVLVAVFDEGDTEEIRYSFKHGRKGSWEKIKLDYKIRARELTTLPDATSLKSCSMHPRKRTAGAASTSSSTWTLPKCFASAAIKILMISGQYDKKAMANLAVLWATSSSSAGASGMPTASSATFSRIQSLPSSPVIATTPETTSANLGSLRAARGKTRNVYHPTQ